MHSANACTLLGLPGIPDSGIGNILASKAFPSPYRTNPGVLKQCNDLLMVGKKTVNIGISLNVVDVNANADMSREDELDECRKITSSEKVGQIDSLR